MKVNIEAQWNELLKEEFEKPYFHELADFVRQEYQHHQCFPKGASIFAAFDSCPLEDCQVVILGQDPYHGPGQAHGLCFSVQEGIAHPPSLINIFKELQADLGIPYPKSGNLDHWARQGVLLLNATLTVRQGEAGSHQGRGWEQFTDAVIQKVSRYHQGLVFVLWGGYAKKKKKIIDTSKHFILECGHPSPLSANRGYWFGNKHFSRANEYLVKQGKQEIDWGKTC